MTSTPFHSSPFTIRLKFILFFSGIIVLIFVSGAFFYWNLSRNMRTELQRRSQSVAESVAANPNLKLGLVNEDSVLVKSILAAALHESDVVYVAACGLGGRFEVIEKSERGTPFAEYYRLSPRDSDTQETVVVRAQRLTTGERFCEIRVPVYRKAASGTMADGFLLTPLAADEGSDRGNMADGRNEYIGFVDLGVSFEHIDEGLRQTTICVAVLLGVMAFLLSGFLFVAFRFVIRPIDAAAQSAAKIAGGDLSQRMPVSSSDEIGHLAFNFNVMAAELARNIDSREQYARQLVSANAQLQESKRQLEEMNKQLHEQYYQVVAGKREWEMTFNAMAEAVFIFNAQRELRKVNTAGSMFGDRWREILGMLPKGTVEQDHRSEEAAAWARVYESVERARFEIEDKETCRNFAVTLDPLAISGKCEGVIAVVRDITEQKKLREQLVHAEKMSAIGQLVAGVAHELNNPLTSVIGYSQLCLDDPCLSGELAGYLRAVVDEGLRAKRIVQNLLTFSRQQEPEKKRVDLLELLRQTAELRTYQLKLSNIEIGFEFEEGLPPVFCDPHQLQQAFLNIILNAEQAMLAVRDSGQLTIQARRAASGVVRVRLTDTGPGIPAEVLSRIFDPFFTTKEVGEGTGLGLSITYGIVNEHGGRIWAENGETGGATFVVELPIAAENDISSQSEPPVVRALSSQPEPSVAREIPSVRMRILVVDDEPAITTVLTRLLEKAGHFADSVHNGREALERIASSRYDLILCDIQMPDMNGMELYDSLREMGGTLAQRMVFLTGDSVQHETLEFLERSGSKYLTKPFVLEDVLAVVNPSAISAAPPEAGPREDRALC